MTVTFTELERSAAVAPLGVRFWDAPTERAIVDGLRLVDVATGRPAIPSHSGVFVVGRGRRGAGDAAYWASPPDVRSVTLELTDGRGRFHAVRFDAEAPLRGVLDAPLFSLPSRPVPAGFAAIRAELTDAHTARPAAWAVLEVTTESGTARGIADREGRVLVLAPYPEPPWHGASPPPGSGPLSAQTWTVELAVRYSPGAASPPLPGPDDPEPPDLCALLEQAPAALAAGTPSVPVETAELAFGRELLLNTQERRKLLVTPPA